MLVVLAMVMIEEDLGVGYDVGDDDDDDAVDGGCDYEEPPFTGLKTPAAMFPRSKGEGKVVESSKSFKKKREEYQLRRRCLSRPGSQAHVTLCVCVSTVKPMR